MRFDCVVLCLFAQLCQTVCYSMDCSLPGAFVLGDSPGKNTGVGCHALLQGIFPTQGSNSGLQHCRTILHHLSHQGSLRILEWIANPFSRGSSDPGIELRSPVLQADSLSVELPRKPFQLFASPWTVACHTALSMEFSRLEYWSG